MLIQGLSNCVVNLSSFVHLNSLCFLFFPSALYYYYYSFLHVDASQFPRSRNDYITGINMVSESRATGSRPLYPIHLNIDLITEAVFFIRGLKCLQCILQLPVFLSLSSSLAIHMNIKILVRKRRRTTVAPSLPPSLRNEESKEECMSYHLLFRLH